MLMLALKHIICSMLCCKFQKINNKQTFQNILYILLLENHATSPLNYESKYFLSVGGSNTTLLKLSLECNYWVNCMQSRLQTNSSQISSLWDLIQNIIILFKTLSWIRCNDICTRGTFFSIDLQFTAGHVTDQIQKYFTNVHAILYDDSWRITKLFEHFKFKQISQCFISFRFKITYN